MGNSAFYLKYRPQSLSDVIGQEAVKKTLLSSFQSDKLSHAYLFVGPRGTGKTSTARILAKMVNCERQNSVILGSEERTTPGSGRKDSGRASLARMTDGIPCNKCSACISITDGSNMDLIEIDAASNRGVEDIRSLRDKIKLSPTSLKKKVYIIDEVHMLTTEAFNALLKTLEEPPKHALFILATTEAAKIPQTILSRVQRLDFKLAKPGEISEALSKIIKEEKIDIEEEAQKALVRRADGSFRDGVKFLDQVSSLKEKITVKSLEESLRPTQFDDLLLLSKSLSEKNTAKSLLTLLKQQENGADIKELALSLMEILRFSVFIKNGLGEQLVKPHFTEDKYEELVNLANSFSNQELIKILDILQNSLEKLKFTSILSLPLELAVVEICTSTPVILSTSTLLSVNSAKDLPRIRDSNKLRDSSPAVQNDKKKPVSVIPANAGIQLENVISELDPRLRGDDKDKSEAPQTANTSEDILKLKEKWTFVLETARSFNFSLEALLRSINIAECNETAIIMEVPYSFHQRILESPKNRNLLEGVFSDILGRNIKISIILGNRPQRKEDIANIEIAADDEIIRAAAEIFNSDTVN